MTQRAEDFRSATDERLLSAFLSGDEAAFASLTQRHADELFRFVTRFVRSAAAADDVVQETFIQVFHSAAGFDTTRRFRPWLYTIAANKARDHLRERTRRQEVTPSANRQEGTELSYLDFLADPDEGPLESVIEDESRAEVRRIVASMPDHLREVLLLGYYQRLPYKEIAEVLAIPLGTVKSRLHAAVSHFAAAYRRVEEQRAIALDRSAGKEIA